ncbi:MAG: hypothetical protein ABGX25_05550 [Nautiliaceae bacterium]
MIYKKEISSYEDVYDILHFLIPFGKKFVLVAKEAGLNIIKHASKGVFKFFKLKNGYKLVFEDFFNNLDIKKAFLIGYSTSKTLGIGLNLIINLVDCFEIIPKQKGKIFIFYLFDKEKVQYCVFSKEFDDIKAFLKVSPYISITTNGDCGIFEKVGKKYFFAFWDIVGHGHEEVYHSSKKLKKLLFGFRFFELKDILEVVRYLYKGKDAALVLGEIKESILFFHFGNIRYFYKGKSFYKESPFFKSSLKDTRISLPRDDIIFFSDGIDIVRNINSFEELSKILKNKKEDDAGILLIKEIKGNIK